MSNLIKEFQERYKTRKEKEEALKKMSNEEIDKLIEAMQNIYGKIYLSKFKK